jgi:hypothetical protein
VPSLGIPVLRALHAVNALAMFWVGLSLGQRTWQQMRAFSPAAAPTTDA